MPSKRTGAVSLKIGRTTLSTASSTFFVFLSSARSAAVISPMRLGHGGVEQHDRERDRLRRADGAELELVAGERERRRAVAVGVVLLDLRQACDAELDQLLLGARRRSFRSAIASMTFVSMSPMNTEMIAGGASFAPRRCSLPDVPMPARSSPACLCTALQHRGEEDEEANVLMRRLARLEQVRAVELRVVRRDRHRPVAVLARAVDAGERLLVQQRLQAVTQRDAAQRRHHELVVVDGDVRLLEASAPSRTGRARLRCAA